MRKTLLLFCVYAIAFVSCKKNDLETQSNKLIGTWQVIEIKPRNLDMQQLSTVVFNYGTYEFRRDNSFTYTSSKNTPISGRWEIGRKYLKNCEGCASSYTYSLRLQSDAIKDNINEGRFSDLKLYSNEFSMLLYQKGVNRWFDYKFQKK